ncbi:MAG: long-chain fatty acid--CoA ligase [Promethearchaeota archaeon]
MAEAPKWPVSDDSPWLKSDLWPEEVPKHPEFPVKTLSELLEEAVAEAGDGPAIWFLHSWVSYNQLKRYVDSLATALHDLGIRKGDVVALVLPNCIQYTVSYYAVVRLGAVVTGINPTYKPLEVLHQLEEVNAKGLICLDSLYESMVAPIVAKHKLDFIISTNVADLATGLSPIKKFLGKLLKKIPSGKIPGSLKFTDLIKTQPNPPKVEIDPVNDPAVYMMTGGTTGVPKAAILTHYNCVSNAIQCGWWMYDREPGMALVGVLPLFHSFAMTVVQNTAIVMRAYTILFPRPPPMNELVDTILHVAPKGGTLFPAVEVLFIRLGQYLEQHPNPELAGMFRLCVSGAGPLHRHVKDMFEAASGGKIVEGYGLAEASPVVSAGPLNDKDHPGKIGLAFPGTDWRIVDQEDYSKGTKAIWEGEGEPPEEGKGKYTGEIAVCGPQVMKGYLNRPEATAETIVEMDGRKWLLTGDIGFMDKTGQITIRDRKKQMIKVKGYAVFPKEVEELIARHESVLEVAVAGLPDPETGELIKAWVQLKPDWVGRITEEELLAWCKENMTHYKVPKLLQIIDEIPKSMVGKVMRRTLQEADPLWQKKA